MAARSSSQAWVKFFTNAGLPSDLSARYAVMFTDHRIQKDMLADLDREILADIGITAAGDKLAILKHAKHVAEQAKQDACSKQLVGGVNQSNKISKPIEKKAKAVLKIRPPAESVQAEPAKTNRPKPIKTTPPVPPTSTKTVFDRLGQEKSHEENSEKQTTVLGRLGNSLTNVRQVPKSQPKKAVVFKVKRSISPVTFSKNDSTVSPKKQSVLDRLGDIVSPSNEASISPVKAPISASKLSKKRDIVTEVSVKRKLKADLDTAETPSKKPISSNAVSSTSAGLFRSRLKPSSSVFSRLGSK